MSGREAMCRRQPPDTGQYGIQISRHQPHVPPSSHFVRQGRHRAGVPNRKCHR
jgi:hypothetical protein